MHLLDRIRATVERLIARLALVGADPRDDEDLRARKALLVLISVLILPVAALWGALYLAFGSPVGVVPLVYFGVLLGAIVVFSRTRDFPWLLRVGQVDILLAPTLSMIPLGGFLDSAGVGLWGILAPLGALVFSEVRSAVRWYVAFLVVFLGSGFAGEVIGPIWTPLPVWFTSTMLALNIAVGGTMMFLLLAVFASQRREALAALRQEQEKAENLLLNILPRSIADRLKAETQPIADQIGSASILFADVVDFTPWSEAARRPPRWSATSITCSVTSTSSRSGTGSRRSRRSATATWSRRAFRHHVPTMLARLRSWRWTCSRRCARTKESGTSASSSGSVSIRARWWPA